MLWTNRQNPFAAEFPVRPMQDVFIGRQPIFDRQLSVFGYELLFRPENAEHSNVIDDDQATSEVILNAFTVIGLDELCGERPAFVNVTGEFLVRHPDIPFPRQRVVLELLESTDATPQLLEVLRRLRGEGFRIALDDFVLRDGNAGLLDFADIVKIDVRAIRGESLRQQLGRLRRTPAQLLAEKVESAEEFERCQAMGFHLFQGYFFSRPANVAGQSVPTNRAATLDLLGTLLEPEPDVGRIEGAISRDVSLSYKLLRYLNSAFFNLPRHIESIRQAVVYLGIRELRVWASLLALAAVPDKPTALMQTLLVRAKMCELLAAEHPQDDRASSGFTVGLLSGLDAVLDMPLPQALDRLPLAPEVRRAVLERQGPLGETLGVVLAYETGDWEALARRGWPAQRLREHYLRAVQWADGLLAVWQQGGSS